MRTLQPIFFALVCCGLFSACDPHDNTTRLRLRLINELRIEADNPEDAVIESSRMKITVDDGNIVTDLYDHVIAHNGLSPFGASEEVTYIIDEKYTEVDGDGAAKYTIIILASGFNGSGDNVAAGRTVVRGPILGGVTPASLEFGPPIEYGNGEIRDGFEECDDGNVASGDGCNATGEIENGWECFIGAEDSASNCDPICGDGVLRGTEQCENVVGCLDGSIPADRNTDSCTEVNRCEDCSIPELLPRQGCVQCIADDKYECPESDPLGECTLKCGNGVLDDGEECDGEVGPDGVTPCYQNLCALVRDDCGNGVVDVPPGPIDEDAVFQGEECDDGNSDAGDGCDSCYQEAGFSCFEVDGGPSICGRCGNGELDQGEGCDDGNNVDGDGCSDCSAPEEGFDCSSVGVPCSPICGDGNLVGGEQCEVSTVGGEPVEMLPEGCSDCRALAGWVCVADGTSCDTKCGDGIVVVGKEECDFGGAFIIIGEAEPEGSEGCNDECLEVSGWNCNSTGCSTACGDGVAAGDEACDDGNLSEVDGCNTMCEVSGEIECGNGIIEFGEQCDDGNTTSGDGCSGSENTSGSPCELEPGYVCVGQPSICSICGNGLIDGAETCDPGQDVEGKILELSGCTTCQIQPGWSCRNLGSNMMSAGPTIQCTPFCGDGYVEDFEGCDDGNNIGGDGCSAFCEIEGGYTCQPPQTPPIDPHGTSSCEATECGDGFIAVGVESCEVSDVEACIDCVEQEGFSCPPGEDCMPDLCGNGQVGGAGVGVEECDDGNTDAGDGCAGCLLEPGWECPTDGAPCNPICGDGVLLPSEGCDDAELPAKNGDGCDIFCRVEPGWVCGLDLQENVNCTAVECGDGIVAGLERCEPDDSNPDDFCTQECDIMPGCGNGLIEPGEECDDGNDNNNVGLEGDGCANCVVAEGYSCVQAPSLCFTTCGDGIQAGDEQCDDDNIENESPTNMTTCNEFCTAN